MVADLIYFIQRHRFLLTFGKWSLDSVCAIGGIITRANPGWSDLEQLVQGILISQGTWNFNITVDNRWISLVILKQNGKIFPDFKTDKTKANWSHHWHLRLLKNCESHFITNFKHFMDYTINQSIKLMVINYSPNLCINKKCCAVPGTEQTSLRR